MRLADKVAVVTGGGKGIGRAYAHGLAREGAAVAIAEVDADAARRTADEIEAAGGKALAVPTDVSNEAGVQAMLREVADTYGHLDVLVNNAALFADMPRDPWEQLSVDDWDRVFAVNVRGVFLCIRAAVPYLRQRGGGSIVNISSTTILNGGNGTPHYVASKAAVMGLTRSLVYTLGKDNIRINTLAPGRTASETLVAVTGLESFAPNTAVRALKRIETPDDLVGTVVFLASDESALMTGQMLVVDGGKDLY